jgi:hypothetical protein
MTGASKQQRPPQRPPAKPVPRPPAAEVEKPPPPPTGAIGGRVVALHIDEGLVRARVVVTSPALAEPRVVMTGQDGRYNVTDLPAGRYTIRVSRTGFVTESIGEAAGAQPPALDLADGQKLTMVDVALGRGGVVSGRIFDEDGAPFEGARVEVLRPQFDQGQRVLSVVGRAFTNDRGEFRIGGLPAGLHFVSAADPAYDSVGDVTGRLDYSPTYHPGVIFPDEATRVEVEAGREMPPIEFKLRIVRPIRVTGRIVAHDERQILAGAVIMTSQHGDKLSPVPAKDVTIRPDGVFFFRNVTPGRYVIRARGETERQGVSLFGTFTTSVEGGDLANISISLTPGAVVEGRVELEATKAPPLVFAPSVRVRAVATDGVVFGDAFSEVVAADGQFVFRGIMPGEHVFRMEGLPDPWVLRAVYLKGREITDVPIDFESGQRVQNFRVVLSDTPTTVTGLVRGRDGQPRPNATVVVFAVDPGLWRPYSRHVRIARPRLDSSYRVRGLPAAEYWIVATLDIDATDLLDPVSLERLVPGATRLTLTAGEAKTMDLQVARSNPAVSIAAVLRRRAR